MSKWKLPNGLVVEADDDAGTITSIKRPAPTAGAAGGRSPGGLTTGPGSVDPDDPLNEGDATGPQYGNATDASRIAADVAQPFRDIGNSALRANSAAANAIVHPVDTARAVKANPAAFAREGLRGVNDNIPFANRAVEAIGGPPADSPEDAATAPGVRDVGSIAAAPVVGGVVGDIAGTVVRGVARPIAAAAKARMTERLPTSITGGATSKSARSVIGARDILRDTVEAHPDLQDPILGGNDTAKHAAISGKLDKLTAANDADFDQVAKAHSKAVAGRVPTDGVYNKLADLAQQAHNDGDEKLVHAVKSVIDSVQTFEADTGYIAPKQLRKIRNDLADNLADNALPGSAKARVAKTNAIKVKGAINGAISDLAAATPGVNADAHLLRNKQIASLLPAQDFLEEKAELAAAKPPGTLSKVAHAVAHPNETIAHVAATIPSRVDQHLARLAGSSGPQGVAALKQVVLSPSRESIQAAVRAGVPPQIALQVARLGSQPPVTQ